MNKLVAGFQSTDGKMPVGRLWRVLSHALLVALPSIFSCSLACAQTSVYHPFPDSNAVWGMTSWCMDGQCGDAAHIQNIYAGDTLIDGFQYKRIQEIFVMTSSNWCCYPPENLGSGFLREDTLAKRVFWRNGGMAQDSLLYDFDVQVGDTLKGYMGSCGDWGQYWTVESIDSLLIGINYRKRINFQVFDPCMRFAIVEGIGSMMGLTTCPYIPFEFGITLQCFTASDSLLYSAPCGPDLEACGDLTSTTHERFSANGPYLRISPNPATDQVWLEYAPGLAMVWLLDATGRRVLERSLQGAPTTILQLAGLAPASYCLVAVDSQGMVHNRKLIKQ